MALKNPFATATPIAKKIKVLLYGASGSGKTLAALSFPRVALIDAEGGADLYAGRPDVPAFAILRTKTVTELEQAIAFIREDGGKAFDTLVIDPITVIYDVLKEATAKTAKNGEIGFREWAKINSRMKSIYNSLTNLPVHVVVIAREATEYETSGGDLRKTGTKADADKAAPYVFDFVVKLNPDHSGAVIKSRGILVGDGGRVGSVNWKLFEPAANAYTNGKTITYTDEADAATEQADEWNADVAAAFTTHWRAQSVTDQGLLDALGVSRLGEWTKGRAAADKAVQVWLTGKAAPPTTNGNGNGHVKPPTEPTPDVEERVVTANRVRIEARTINGKRTICAIFIAREDDAEYVWSDTQAFKAAFQDSGIWVTDAKAAWDKQLKAEVCVLNGYDAELIVSGSTVISGQAAEIPF